MQMQSYFFCIHSIIQHPLQVMCNGKMYRLSAVCNEQIEQK